MEKRRGNVVLFPFMAQGHIIPFLALAHQMEQNGYTVTFVNTPHNIKKLHKSLLQSSTSIKLVEIPFDCSNHGLPPEAENTDSLPYSLILRLIQSTPSLELPFKNLLSDLIQSQGGEKPVCVVSDFFFGWAADVAHEFGILHAIFSGTGGFGMACYYSLWLNLPHKHTHSVEFSLPDFEQAGELHVSQLALSMVQAGEGEPWTNFMWENLRKWSRADAILFNTVEDLDKIGLNYFRHKLKIPVWPVGPVLLSEQSRASTGADECIQWLDKKEANSVLYISFGSQNTISASQMMKLANSLDASSRNFIWVVRPPLGSSTNTEFETEKWLPEGFLRRVQDQERGLIIKRWAPQVQILGHKSVGAFLSHCGWNSILESLKNGVPLIGWPMAAEQFYNSKFLVEELEVCIELARGTNAEIREEDIMEKIELVMGENEKGKEMRRRAGEIREMIKAAMRDEGDYKGSSVTAMEEFFDAAKSSRF